MLTKYDLDMMRNTIVDIIPCWNMTATIYKPKPEEEQTNFNSIMREYTGDIEYDIIENVPVERLEVVNDYNAGDLTHIKAGRKTDASVIYKFPEIFKGKPLIITSDMVFTFDGNDEKKYQVDTIRKRIGETLVDLNLIAGGTDSGY